jgi:probable HAF family extracellular repeat protein
MQPRFTTALLLLGLAACADHTTENAPSVAADLRGNGLPRYRVTKLTSNLGGNLHRITGINLLGSGAGYSTFAGDSIQHAVRWRGNHLDDLGTLGGLHSRSNWPGINELGTVVGISYTNVRDTLNEAWSCEAFLPATDRACRGFIYQNGRMKELPTLGGTHGFATGINNRGQVVGWAQTRVLDPTCNVSLNVRHQFRAVMWEPNRNKVTELKPWRGDSTSAATAINERGQVVGISGECDQAVGRFSARNAVLWENGRVTKLPNLGGTSWHTPMAINERGDVVGFSNPKDPRDDRGEFIARAFLWTKRGGIVNIGNLPGDSTSQALGINIWGQVVGFSTGGSAGSRGFIYQNGVLTNVNELLEPGFPDSILSVSHINDLGVISGRLLEVSTRKSVPFIAVPSYRSR